MTARDMLKRDLKNPELTDKFIDIIVHSCCPSELDYEERCMDMSCHTCWDCDIVNAENTEEVKETTDMLEKFDYETEYEELRAKIDELTRENVTLTANRAKLMDDVRYWMDKAKRYELIVKAVEALVGRNIISEEQDD